MSYLPYCKLNNLNKSIPLCRFCLCLSIFFLPFSNAFALGQFRNLSFLFLVFGLMYTVFAGELKVVFLHEYLYIFFFIIISLISWIIEKNAYTFLAFTGIFLTCVSFIGFYQLLYFSNIRIKRVYKSLVLTSFISASYGIIYYILKNIFNVDLDNYIFRYSLYKNIGSGLGGIVRTRSFFGEPGTFAFFLVATSSIGLLYFIKYKKDNILLFLYLSIIITSLFFTFGAGAVFLLFFSAIFVMILLIKDSIKIFIRKVRIDRRKISLVIYIIVSMLLIIILFEYFFHDSYYYALFQTKYNLTSSSSLDRISKFEKGLQLLLNATNSNYELLFGQGMDKFASVYHTGVLNFYLKLLIEYGIFGFIFWMLLFLSIFNRIIKINGIEKYFFLFSYTSILCNLFISSGAIMLLYINFIFAFSMFVSNSQKINRD